MCEELKRQQYGKTNLIFRLELIAIVQYFCFSIYLLADEKVMENCYLPTYEKTPNNVQYHSINTLFLFFCRQVCRTCISKWILLCNNCSLQQDKCSYCLTRIKLVENSTKSEDNVQNAYFITQTVDLRKLKQNI